MPTTVPQNQSQNQTLNLKLSQEIAKQIKSLPKQCFENSHKAALKIPGSLYVQGFLVIATAPPLEHSWIELEDNLIDPSLPHLPKKQAATFSYFPAQRLTLTQLKAAIENAKEDYPEDPPLPIYGTEPYEYYGDLMLGGMEYQKAYEAALKHSKSLRLIPKT